MGNRTELPESFEETRAAILQTRSNQRRWELMSHLCRWPGEARAAAFELLAGRGVVQRMDGAELMGALCALQPDHIREFALALVEAFDRETDEDLLSFIFFSLHLAVAHEGDKPPSLVDGEWQMPARARRKRPAQPIVWELLASERAAHFARVAALARSRNPARREALAKSLESFLDLDPAAVETLLELTRDPDIGPREAATHVLASSPEMLELPEARALDVLAALWERVFDSDCAIRNEAAYGLALRRDPRAVDVVERQLREDEVTLFLARAAHELADRRLVPGIKVILEWWPPEGGDAWAMALRACQRGARKTRAAAPPAAAPAAAVPPAAAPPQAVAPDRR
jgi:hypothetical protein